MCHQKTALDRMTDVKKGTIMVTALKLALMSVAVCLLAAMPPAYAGQGKRSISKLWTLADTETVPGARSRLVRRDDEICMNIYTRMLPEGAYTVWWFVFNNPQRCTDPADVGGARCGPGDQLTNTPVNFSAVWATGGIAGPDGLGYFSACLKENMLPPFPQRRDVDGDGLANAQGAEIHLVVRSHCAAEVTPIPPDDPPGVLGAQISRFGGGCTPQTGGEHMARGGLALARTSNSPFIRRKSDNMRTTVTIKEAIFRPSLRRYTHSTIAIGPVPPTDGGTGSAPTEVLLASAASVACPEGGDNGHDHNPSSVRPR
jgi:hypothetical protein